MPARQLAQAVHAVAKGVAVDAEARVRLRLRGGTRQVEPVLLPLGRDQEGRALELLQTLADRAPPLRPRHVR